MLWESIYLFFVKHIFGGHYGNTAYLASLGEMRINGQWVQQNTAMFNFYEFANLNGDTAVMSFGNYMSLLCTSITIIFIVVLCCLFIWKIIKLIGGLIK